MTIAVLTANYFFKTAKYIEQQVQTQMQVARNVLQQTIAQQEQVLTTAANVLAADFGFKQAVATGDKKTIESALYNHGKRINADLVVLMDLEGESVSISTNNRQLPQDLSPYVSALPLRAGHAQVLNIESDVYQVIVVPVKAPRIIAYAYIGFLFDRNALVQLKDVSSLDVTLMRDEHIVQSSFENPKSSLGSGAIAPLTTLNLVLSDSDYYHQRIPFAGSNEIWAILSSPLDEIHRDFKQLVVATLLGALMVLIIALALSGWLSRRITMPLRRLQQLTKDIGGGNFNVPAAKGDLPLELNELYQGFVLMGSAIATRETKIKYQAEHDLLTGLFNRERFLEKLQEQLLSHASIALINVNVKGFKRLNDTIGVANGDKLLIEIAERLSAFCKKCDAQRAVLTSRTSADDFLIALPVSSLDELSSLISLLRAELERPFWLEELNLLLNFYYGIANSKEDGKDAEKLVRRVSMAASLGVQEQLLIRHYQQGEDEAYLFKLRLIEELKQALEAHDSPLFMNYQPKVNLQTGAVDKLEALIRWVNKEGEFVNPELFVGLAEKSSLIVALTQWVIRRVITQVATWNEQGMQFNVSINLSAQDIQAKGFVGFLLDTIGEFNVSATQIILELTERDLADNEALVVSRLTHLKSLGFEVSVDDYGIGQSSLAKLKSLPVDELKIDKCFILSLDQSQQDQDIVSSTIELGHKLGLRVVAEGVENEQSMALLKQFGCDYAQGYYLSRPLKADQLIVWYQDYEKDN
ncbi:putative bifunctional diguanylate cyclase/phosphodiesterase [Pseudoalteromonas sp. SSDWG2]|uniref:putative bifunctional diguanylate cyclase/phosphodiesterase n=1 Tax=Pseudoalteromonas sp. SSDWG2 TaxID=3139391 RepID=UPI003BA921DE